MNFFDQATADLSSMHNVDEFARFLSINKVGESGATAVACILDEELAPVSAADGVREWDATLYVPAASLPEEPVIDQRFELVGDSLPGGAKSVVVVHTNTIHNERIIRLRWFDS